MGRGWRLVVQAFRPAYCGGPERAALQAYMIMIRRLIPIALVFGLAVALPGAQGQQPARDTPAQQTVAPAPGGRMSGRVIAADTGRPVKRARVFVTAAELPGGRGVLTDDSGAFDFTELPAGRYTLTASKSGFIGLSYGQRRPLQAGTPLQLADGQQLKGIDFRLPRGGVLAGHVFDTDGDAMPGVMVRVMRYQQHAGRPAARPAGTAQTDDKGVRVWGLNPGDYYVNAITRLEIGGGGGGRIADRAAERAAAAPPRLLASPMRLAARSAATWRRCRRRRRRSGSAVGCAHVFPWRRLGHGSASVAVGLSRRGAGHRLCLAADPTSRVSGRVQNPTARRRLAPTST